MRTIRFATLLVAALVAVEASRVSAEEDLPPLVARAVLFHTTAGDRPKRIDSDDYQKMWEWQADRYFADPTALAACAAIERGDVDGLERLIDGGFDVDHRGRAGMTVLLYSLAFPGESTRLLLEKGADPNLPLDSERGGLFSGTTATQIIAGFGAPEDFEYILDHGTDPNLLSTQTYIPLHVHER